MFAANAGVSPSRWLPTDGVETLRAPELVRMFFFAGVLREDLRAVDDRFRLPSPPVAVDGVAALEACAMPDGF